MHPEQSTSAMVAHHPEAKYFAFPGPVSVPVSGENAPRPPIEELGAVLFDLDVTVGYSEPLWGAVDGPGRRAPGRQPLARIPAGPPPPASRSRSR